MKLWLDDIRKPPWGYDLWAKTADECIEMLQRYGDEITHASLDHDLADAHYVSDVAGGYCSPLTVLRNLLKVNHEFVSDLKLCEAPLSKIPSQ